MPMMMQNLPWFCGGKLEKCSKTFITKNYNMDQKNLRMEDNNGNIHILL
jgi:hypothetical protein